MPAPQTLPFNLVREMVDQYRNNQLDSIQRSTAHPLPVDAHSIWFDLATLKRFISDIESAVAEHPELPTRNLGLRLYYSAYPPNSKWNAPGYEPLADLLNDPVTRQYEKLHTLVLVPTTEVGAVNHDFDPTDPNTYNGGGHTRQQIMAANHGHLIPPKTAIGEWF